MKSVESVASFFLNPITDPRWPKFVDTHPDASIFHTREWMDSLRKTYAFTPMVLTTNTPSEPLTNGIPFCRVRSLLTGTRLVSLPFSDHCQPLSPSENLLNALPELCRQTKLKYIEFRPLDERPLPGLFHADRFLFHKLDLRPSLVDIHQKFHADCIRRKIRRAERDGLVVESGRSDSLLRAFYTLQVATRKRHGLPPQPRQWFCNLMESMGEKATIRVARLSGRPIAAILTLTHQRTEVYKYGCSEAEDSKSGGTPLLLWKAIEDAKARGMEELDLGRCDIENEGLATFKERWGAERGIITYYRYPEGKAAKAPNRILSRLPKPVLIAAGRLLYRHIA